MAFDYGEHFPRLWDRYPNKKCKREGYSSYEKRLKEWLKDNPGKDESQFASYLILQYELEENHNQLKKRAGKFVPQQCGLSVWLNQRRYEDEFEESASSLKGSTNNFKCHKCDATERLFAAHEGQQEIYLCAEHYREKDAKHENLLRDTAVKLVKQYPRLDGETWQQWHRRVTKETLAGGAMRKLPYDKRRKLA